MESERACLEALARVGQELARRGVTSIGEPGRLVVPVEAGGLTAALMAACEAGSLRALGVVYDVGRRLAGLGPEARARLYEALLRIPATYRISVALDEEGDLVVDFLFARTPGVQAMDVVSASAMVLAQLAEWLSRQLERAARGEEVEPFTVSP